MSTSSAQIPERAGDPETRFRRLARSSPWLWSSVRFTVDDVDGRRVRASVRRPDGLRVETEDGVLLHVKPGDPAPPGMGMLTFGWPARPARADRSRLWWWGPHERRRPAPGRPAGGAPAPGPSAVGASAGSDAGGAGSRGMPALYREAASSLRSASPASAGVWWTDPSVPRPIVDAEHLVVDPVELPPHVQVDDPMWQSYRWVAMLNPRELADGRDGVGVDVADVIEVLRDGRPSLRAALRPRDGYAPRCSCCPLLPSRPAVITEGYGDPDGPFADEHQVVLDLATGICVSAREVGGPFPGRGFSMQIEAVDEALPDSLFAAYP